MEKYGLDYATIKWLQSCLNSCTQAYVNASRWKQVSRGTLQGSVLGSLLSNIFIYNLGQRDLQRTHTVGGVIANREQY